MDKEGIPEAFWCLREELIKTEHDRMKMQLREPHAAGGMWSWDRWPRRPRPLRMIDEGNKGRSLVSR